MNQPWMIRVESVSKSFTLHVQGGAHFSVLNNFSLEVAKGESVALVGPSGIGKSSLLRMVYGNYKTSHGRILVRCGAQIYDVTRTSPQTILQLRQNTIGYVSQFLRVIPRISTLDVVMEPLLLQRVGQEEARTRAETILDRLAIPSKLWGLSPKTFSGGEQQRVNIARVFVCNYSIVLLDEPTASLDPHNRHAVITLIREAQKRGGAILGVYHDALVRRQASDRTVTLGN